MRKHSITTEYIQFNPHGCIDCLRCKEACPRQVIGEVKFLWHRHAVLVNPDACIGCGKCVKVCPKGCFKVKTWKM